MRPRFAVPAALALIVAPLPAAADLPRPNPDVRRFSIGDWQLWCVIAPADGVLRDCALSVLAGWVSLRVQVSAGVLQYSVSRTCARETDPAMFYRSGRVPVEPVHRSALWRDFAALWQMPVDPGCTGTPPGVGGNFQANTETALAMLRSLHPLPPAPAPSNP